MDAFEPEEIERLIVLARRLGVDHMVVTDLRGSVSFTLGPLPAGPAPAPELAPPSKAQLDEEARRRAQAEDDLELASAGG